MWHFITEQLQQMREQNALYAANRPKPKTEKKVAAKKSKKEGKTSSGLHKILWNLNFLVLYLLNTVSIGLQRKEKMMIYQKLTKTQKRHFEQEQQPRPSNCFFFHPCMFINL